MRQIHRYGIELDVCATTGGVWLDKGELEKLIALVKEETLAEASPPQRRNRDADEDYEDDRRGGRHGAKHSCRSSRLLNAQGGCAPDRSRPPLQRPVRKILTTRA